MTISPAFSSLLAQTRCIRPSALTALRTLVFRPCALLETTMVIPALAAKGTSSPYHLACWAEKKGRPSATTRRRRSLGPSSLIWFRPELSYQHAPCFFSTAVDERIESSGGSQTGQQSGCREDGAAAVLIGLRWPTRRRSRASPSSPSWSAVRCRWLPVVCASRRQGLVSCFLSMLFARGFCCQDVVSKRVKLLLAVDYRVLARRLSSHALSCPRWLLLKPQGHRRNPTWKNWERIGFWCHHHSSPS